MWDGDEASAQCKAADPEHFNRFWCRKFELSPGFSTGKPKLVPRDDFRMISAFDRSIFDLLEKDLDPHDWATMTELFKIRELPTFKKEKLGDAIQEAAEKNALLYFFGHTRRSKTGPKPHHEFLFTDTDAVTVGDFESMLTTLFGDQGGGNGNLLFLNACETILDDSDYSFRSAAAVSGISGIIAAEAEVPRDFAATYAAKLLGSLVLGGQPLEKAVQSLRMDKALWPGSLLYSCYVSSQYRIDTPSA